MEAVRYCTPEWLEEMQRSYNANTAIKETLRKLSSNLAFRITAEPAWGIERDILFWSFMEKGELTRNSFCTEEDARREVDFILSATPQGWKNLLTKKTKFVTDFMLGKVKLEMGSKVAVLGLAPHSGNLITGITQMNIVFQDDMSAEEVEEFRAYMKKFRDELGV